MAGLVPTTLRELPQDELEAMPVVGLDDAPVADETVMVDPKTGAISYLQPDGSAIIDLEPNKEESKEAPEEGFDANLAVGMDEGLLDQIGEEICEGIDDDIRSRADFEGFFSKAVDLLGVKYEEATGTAGSDGTISKIYSPLLLEAVVKYQANFIGEMLPAGGPAKVRDDFVPSPFGPQPKRDEIAEAFETDLNHYLTVTAKEFYPDTDRMSFSQGLFGNGFKKQYHCPLRRRPVSESIPMQDLIVSNDVTDLMSAIRVTHRLRMSPAIFKRMQLNKSYRKVDISTPEPIMSEAERKIGEVEGVDKTPRRPQDHTHVIYETLVDLDLEGYEHEEDGEKTGLPLPYKVTIERDSHKVLAIRRNWKEGDEDYTKIMRIVHYPLVPGLGFYAYGFIQLLGNTTRALTGVTRLLLDAGQFATFPGFLLAKGGAKQATTELRVNPGMGKEIDTGGKPIQDVIMRIPYGEPSPTLQNMSVKLTEDGMRLAGSAQIPVGEGRADVPVGTMMAAVEQVTKVIAAVHKRNHQAQQQELINIRELFAEDPAALSKFAGKEARRQWQVAEEFTDLNLVPASDPNVPSHIHRIMIATALLQMSGSQTGLQIYNQQAVHEKALRVLGIVDPESLFKPPTPPGAAPPNPEIALKQKELAIKEAELQMKAKDQQLKDQQQQREAGSALLESQSRQQAIAAEAANDAAQRAHEMRLAVIRAGTESQKEKIKGIAAMEKERSAGIMTLAETKLQAEEDKKAMEMRHSHERKENDKDRKVKKASPKKGKKK